MVGWTYLGTDVVRQDLDCVPNKQSGPGTVVEDVVDENHSDHGIGSRFGPIDCKAGGADCPDYEDAKHTGGRNEEQRSSSNAVDEKARAYSNDDVDYLENPVDQKLGG